MMDVASSRNGSGSVGDGGTIDGGSGTSGGGIHAVSRSNELLACARTALKLAQTQYQKQLKEQQQQQQQQGGGGGGNHNNSVIDGGTVVVKNSKLTPEMATLPLNELSLWKAPDQNMNDNMFGGISSSLIMKEQQDAIYDTLSPPEKAIHDCVTLIQMLHSLKNEIQTLVKRRGHTNDPTEEIGKCMTQFQHYTKELLEEINTIPKLVISTSSSNNSSSTMFGLSFSQSPKHQQQHYQLVSKDLQAQAKILSQEFQKALERRSEILKEQAQRRKLLSSSSSSAAAATNGTSNINGHHNNENTAAESYFSSSKPPSSNRNSVNSGGPISSSFYSASSVSQLPSPLMNVSATSSLSSTARQRRKGTGKETAGTTPYQNSYNSHTSHTSTSATSYYGSNHASGTTTTTTMGMRHRQKAGMQDNTTTTGATATASTTPYGPYSTSYASTGQQYSHSSNPYYSSSSTAYASAYGGSHHYSAAPMNPYSSVAMSSWTSNSANDYTQSDTQAMLQERQNKRNTKQRLDNARQAESMIAQLQGMFTKMATIVQSQSETITRIEEDVETASLDVERAHDELIKLNEITKGNRGLIIKTFAILIMMILFLRLY